MLSASEIFHEHGVDEHYLARVLPELFEGQPQPRSRKEPSRTKDLHAIGKTAQLRYIQETLDSCQGGCASARDQPDHAVAAASLGTLSKTMRLGDAELAQAWTRPVP